MLRLRGGRSATALLAGLDRVPGGSAARRGVLDRRPHAQHPRPLSCPRPPGRLPRALGPGPLQSGDRRANAIGTMSSFHFELRDLPPEAEAFRDEVRAFLRTELGSRASVRRARSWGASSSAGPSATSRRSSGTSLLAGHVAAAGIAAENAFRAADRGDPVFEVVVAKVRAGEAAGIGSASPTRPTAPSASPTHTRCTARRGRCGRGAPSSAARAAGPSSWGGASPRPAPIACGVSSPRAERVPSRRTP